jgi:Domain of unknown function (DUF1330)
MGHRLPKGKFAIIQFPSMQALQDRWHSPAYAAVRPLREKSTVARLFALEGIPPDRRSEPWIYTLRLRATIRSGDAMRDWAIAGSGRA